MINEGGTLINNSNTINNGSKEAPDVPLSSSFSHSPISKTTELVPGTGYGVNKVNKKELTSRLNPKSRLEEMEESASNKKMADAGKTKESLFSYANAKSVERKKILEHLLTDSKVVNAMGLKGMSTGRKIEITGKMIGGARGYGSKKEMTELGKCIKANKTEKLKGLLPDKVISRFRNQQFKQAVLDNITQMTKRKF